MAHLDCGTLMQMGPTWGKHSEEWILTFGFPAEASMMPLYPAFANSSSSQISKWRFSTSLMSLGPSWPCLYSGDAAQRRPPTTGLGLNTGIEDAANIAWKLGQVVNGKASVALMDSYEAKRRPVGIRNSDRAFFTFGTCKSSLLVSV